MDYLGYFLVAGIAAIGCGVGYAAARYWSKGVLFSIWAILLGTSAVMAGMMNTTPGWDAITYAVILFGACAPAGLGLLIGSVIGWLKRKPVADA